MRITVRPAPCCALKGGMRMRRRRTYKPHEITWDAIKAEATGKQFVMPCTDKHGRTIVVMRPR